MSRKNSLYYRSLFTIGYDGDLSRMVSGKASKMLAQARNTGPGLLYI